jgi:hypothetical protein
MFNFWTKSVDWLRGFLTDVGLEGPLKSIGTNVTDVAQATWLLGVGFVAGFLARQTFKILFISLLVLIGGIKFFEMRGFLTVDWASIYAQIGFSNGLPIDSIQALLLGYLDWVKVNLVPAFGLIVGLYFGLTS